MTVQSEFPDTERDELGPAVLRSIAATRPTRVTFERLRGAMARHAEALSRHEAASAMARLLADRERCYLVVGTQRLEVPHTSAAALITESARAATEDAARLHAILQRLVLQLP